MDRAAPGFLLAAGGGGPSKWGLLCGQSPTTLILSPDTASFTS